MAAWLERSDAAKQNMLTVSGQEATVGNGQGAEAGQVCWHMSLRLATQLAAVHAAGGIAASLCRRLPAPDVWCLCTIVRPLGVLHTCCT